MKPLLLVFLIGLLFVVAGCIGTEPASSLPSASSPSLANTSLSPPANASVSASDFRRLMDNDIRLGNDSAPVVLIEFADFQCPYSRQWWKESFRLLEKEYIAIGKVQFIYRDYPLRIHPAGPLAAEAAECAREQGKWREMHDAIFREQSKEGDHTVSFGPEELRRWADRIPGINSSAWETCFVEGTYRGEVQRDVLDGKALHLTSTPSFLLGKRNGFGELLVGAYPYPDLKKKLDALLNEPTS